MHTQNISRNEYYINVHIPAKKKKIRIVENKRREKSTTNRGTQRTKYETKTKNKAVGDTHGLRFKQAREFDVKIIFP